MKNTDLCKFTFRDKENPERTVTCYGHASAKPSDLVSPGYELVSRESATYTYATLAQEVAALLPGTWSAAPAKHFTDRPDAPFVLSRLDGLAIWFAPFRAYGREGKGAASYHRPVDKQGKRVGLYDAGNTVSDPSINYALTKTPEQIARDIARRLIPEAEALHPRVMKAIASADEYADKEVKAQEVAKRLKGGAGVYFRANGSQVEVRGYVSPEIAARIDELLATLAKE